MNKIKLSIVVAVYNLEKYLPRCLDALVNQTLQEIEILCVDDGSTDSASQIIDDYEKKYPEKVKAFHKPNGGEFTTRNYGLERATGEYITFIDPDDYIETNMIERAIIISNKYNADIVQWNSYYNKDKEQIKRKPITPELIERKNKEIELFQLDILSTI